MLGDHGFRWSPLMVRIKDRLERGRDKELRRNW
jgi:hypothetical protein